MQQTDLEGLRMCLHTFNDLFEFLCFAIIFWVFAALHNFYEVSQRFVLFILGDASPIEVPSLISVSSSSLTWDAE